MTWRGTQIFMVASSVLSMTELSRFPVTSYRIYAGIFRVLLIGIYTALGMKLTKHVCARCVYVSGVLHAHTKLTKAMDTY